MKSKLQAVSKLFLVLETIVKNLDENIEELEWVSRELENVGLRSYAELCMECVKTLENTLNELEKQVKKVVEK